MRILLTISLFIFIDSILSAQSDEAHIDQIRKWYVGVENGLENCEIIEISEYYDEEIYNGSPQEIKGWIQSNQFTKIQVTEMADWHEETSLYYLMNGELFFLFIKGYYGGEMYTAKELEITEEELFQSGPVAKTLDHYEHRVYFKGEQAINLLSKNKSFPADESEPDLSAAKNNRQPITQADWEIQFPYIKRVIKALRENK